jgi:hypothetical protein
LSLAAVRHSVHVQGAGPRGGPVILDIAKGAHVDTATHAAVTAYSAALQTGVTRSAAFDMALAAWRASHPEQSEFRAVADVATAIRAFVPQPAYEAAGS